MKQQALKTKLEEAAKEKAAARVLEQDQKEGGRRSSHGSKRGRDDDRNRVDFDPDHPNRRPTELFNSRRGGVALQGGELVELAHWVTVVAKIPVKDQRSLYRSSFENAVGGFNVDFDSPNYLGYFVQRAEIVPGQELVWQDLPVYDAKGTPTREQVGSVMGARPCIN